MSEALDTGKGPEYKTVHFIHTANVFTAAVDAEVVLMLDNVRSTLENSPVSSSVFRIVMMVYNTFRKDRAGLGVRKLMMRRSGQLERECYRFQPRAKKATGLFGSPD